MWLKSQIESLTERVNEIQAIISSDNQAIFVTPGSFTFNVPSGVTSVTVQCQGAGGSGAGVWERHGDWGAGAGGGSGAYAKAIIAVTPNSGIPVTIGAGGASVSGEALGIAGGTTSFGSYITCTGGGGSRNYEGNWIDGQAGNNGNPGNGGNSALGTGGTGYNWDCNGCVGQAGVGYGSGGGAGGDSVAGGAGAPGYVALRYGRDV